MSARKESVSADEEEGCWSSFCSKISDFRKFLWDPETRTVFGRGGKSWGQILVFYAFYYAFLACLFAVSITIVLGVLDPYVPRYQTRLQAPGVTIQPKLPSRKALTSDIKYSVKGKTFSTYTIQLDNFLEKFNPGNQSDPVFFRNCSHTKVVKPSEFDDDEISKACTYYREVLGKCAARPYGYDVGKPCIYVKVNRIINWYPVGFTDLSKAKGTDESFAPPLSSVLKKNKRQYDPNLMYISCYGFRDQDQKNLNGELGVSSNTKYFPEDNGIPFEFYPYLGNKRQPSYVQPVVAVQFTNVTRNVEILVACKAYAANIVDDKRMQIGYFRFSLQIDD